VKDTVKGAAHDAKEAVEEFADNRWVFFRIGFY